MFNFKYKAMKKFFLLSLVSVMLLSCNDNDDNANSNALRIDIQGLENLGPDYVYEGWLVNGSNVVTAGRFSVNDSGELSQSTFQINANSLNTATTYVLTIEPAVGDDPSPSSVHILAGEFVGNSGSMTVTHGAALGNNFTSSAGKYILATPTDGGSMDNEESGVWFLDNSSGSPMNGLTLPTLPAGWKYEGWAVINGTPISTGKFLTSNMADENAATSPYKGTVNFGPSFPGEDFLQNAPTGLTFPTDLRGGTVVISIEPEPDNSPNPFLLKPLVHPVPSTAITHTVLNMNQNLMSLPEGTFSR